MEDHLLSIDNILSKYNLKKPKKTCKVALNSNSKNNGRKEAPNKIFPDRDHSLIYLICCGIFDPVKILSFVSVTFILIIYLINKEERKQLLLFLFTLIIIIISTFIEIYCESNINQFYKRKEIEYNTRVIVNDHIYQIENEFVKKGDIIVLKRGDIVPADSILISTNNLYIQRSAISDDKSLIMKSHTKRSIVFENSSNVVLAGDKIISGRGRAVVVRVGKETKIDEVYKKTIQMKNLESLLYTEINLFFIFSMAIALLLALILVLLSIITGSDVVKIIDVIFSICLALIPECIPPTVKFMLFSACLKLEKKGITIRDVGVIEKLGLITMVCADKNAFISPESLFVSKIYNGNKIFDIDLVFEDEDAEALSFFRDICYITSLISANKLKLHQKKYHTSLGVLSQIFSRYFISINRMSTKIRDIEIHNLDGTLVDDLDFKTVYITGPVESVLKFCTRIKLNGQIQKLTSEKRNKILYLYSQTKNSFNDLIALAYRSFSKNEKRIKIEGSIFLCIYFLEELVSFDTTLVTNILKSAHIGFSLVSDISKESQLETSKNIVGIDNKDSDHPKFLTSFELYSSNLHFRSNFLNSENFIVFQSNSEDKKRIIKDLKELNHIVCFIGTDLGDCQAMSEADVSICFENSGVICKEACSIVIKSESTEDLLYCIEEGRLFFVNLQKAIKYITGHIMPQFIPFVFYTCFGTPIAVSPILLIFLNYLIEMIPAIHFLYEEPEDNLLIQKPAMKKYIDNLPQVKQPEVLNGFFGKIKSTVNNIRKVIGRGLIYQMNILTWHIFETGIVMSIGCMLGFFTTLYHNDVPISKMFFSANTFFEYGAEPLELSTGEIIDFEKQLEILFKGESTYFFGLIICQFASMLICRREHNYFFYKFFNNLRILIYSILGIIVSVAIIYLSFFQSFLLIRSPCIIALTFPLGSAIFILLSDTLKKYKIKNFHRPNDAINSMAYADN